MFLNHSSSGYIPIVCMLSIFLFSSCDQIKAALSEKPNNENLVKAYHDNGKLKSEVSIDENKKRHGITKQYFSSGQLKTEIHYDHGTKTQATQYYENGEKQMEFFYKDGKKHGKRTKYWSNGKVQSVLEYHEDNPKSGLEEYDKNGQKITTYPSLKVVHIDNVDKTGTYTIQVYFSNNTSRGEYFFGQLENGVFNNRLIKLEMSNKKGVITYKPIPGTFIMEKINVIGKYKTPLGNPYFVQKQVNVAIDF